MSDNNELTDEQKSEQQMIEGQIAMLQAQLAQI
ncbi:hypothetical protein [Candidatus Erwinia dacicola]